MYQKELVLVPDSTQSEPNAVAVAGIPPESWGKVEPGKLSESWLKPSPGEALLFPVLNNTLHLAFNQGHERG